MTSMENGKKLWIGEQPSFQIRLRFLISFLFSVLSVFVLAFNLGCQKGVAYNDPMPEHDEFTMDSAATGEPRNVNVYLPPEYSSSETDYPVLYMPDGGTQEDFPHVANTLDSLIKQGAIAPLILVGVENTNRHLDMTCKSEVEYDLEMIPKNGGSAAFRKFFGSELRPEIQKRYRCNGETGLVGESLAGLFVIETFVTEPVLFDRYIAFDPSLWWNEASLVGQAEAAVAGESYSGRTVWFASSDAEDIVTHVEGFEAVLSEKANEGLRWNYKPNPAEQHSTIFRAEKENAFRSALWKTDGDL